MRELFGARDGVGLFDIPRASASPLRRCVKGSRRAVRTCRHPVSVRSRTVPARAASCRPTRSARTRNVIDYSQTRRSRVVAHLWKAATTNRRRVVTCRRTIAECLRRVARPGNSARIRCRVTGRVQNRGASSGWRRRKSRACPRCASLQRHRRRSRGRRADLWRDAPIVMIGVISIDRETRTRGARVL